MCKYLLCFLVVGVGLLWNHRAVRAEIFDECADEEDGTYVQSWESCQSYVYCMGEDSGRGDCDDGEYFDADSGSCDARENVRCFLDEVDEPPIEEPDDEEQVEEEEEQPEPTPPTVTEPNAEVDFLNIAPVVKPTCPITDDPSQVILMPSNDSCTDYYLCYHGHAMEMHCTDQLHFNSFTGQCDYPEKAHCLLERPSAHKCLPTMTDFFPHPDNCNYFYYCIKGFLTLQQCPFYYGWDVQRRSCVQINVAECYGNSRRT
ncbi:probable chitinase 10 [Drosophila tropicalis]|uniref:probable chitinase 10 n=1 Tax=Drosophila tropicalis TaxID=46794 RepID=UPI0035ABD003